MAVEKRCVHFLLLEEAPTLGHVLVYFEILQALDRLDSWFEVRGTPSMKCCSDEEKCEPIGLRYMWHPYGDVVCPEIHPGVDRRQFVLVVNEGILINDGAIVGGFWRHRRGV